MRFVVLLLFISFSIKGYSKDSFIKCKLFFTNSNVVEGFATLPTNISMDNKIKYKKTKKSDNVIKLENEKLEEIIYYIKNDRPVFFLNSRFYKSTLNDKSKIEKKLFRNYWMVRSLISEKLIMYTLSQDYKVNKEGGLTSYSSNSVGFGSYSTIILAQKPKEKYPTMISFHSLGFVNNGDKFFKRIALAYFKDNKKLIKRIKNNEFSLETYDELIRAYCNCNYKDNFYIHY
jgi:hypothetical protein